MVTNILALILVVLMVIAISLKILHYGLCDLVKILMSKNNMKK